MTRTIAMKLAAPAALMGVLAAPLLVGSRPAAAQEAPKPKDDAARIADLEEKVRRLEADVAWLRDRLGFPGQSGESADPFSLVPLGDAPAPEPPAAFDEPARPLRSGLEWLARSQGPDGAWRSPGGRHDVAATSLAVLAFLGNGHTHRISPSDAYRLACKNALSYLKRQQARSGLIGYDPASQAALLDHQLATMAVCEAYAVSRDFTLKRVAESAVEGLRGAQAKGGGWGWEVGAASPNTLATTYGVLALKTAKSAGFDCASEDFVAAREVLVAASDGNAVAGYRAAGDAASVTLGGVDEAPSVPLLAAGAATARIYTGERRDAVRGAIAHLSRHRPSRERAEPTYWYLGTLALFQGTRDEALWTRWQVALRGTLAGLQVEEGDDAGSFEPAGIIGALGGRAATTAECLLALEVHFRYERVRDR